VSTMTADRPPVSGEPRTEGTYRREVRFLLENRTHIDIGNVTRILDRFEAEARATPPSLDMERIRLIVFGVTGYAFNDYAWDQIAAEYLRLTSKEEQP